MLNVADENRNPRLRLSCEREARVVGRLCIGLPLIGEAATGARAAAPGA
jgi:hypothetical protein